MRRAFCAIFLTTLLASNSRAGYVGQINLSTGSGSQGSLGVMGTAPSTDLVGTNLSAPSLETLGSSPSTVPLTGSYLDFQTGTYQGTDASGVAHYAAGGNFFILDGTLDVAAGTPPLASSLTTGPATVTSLAKNEFELTMTFTGGYLSDAFATAFGQTYVPLPDGRIYSGTVDFIFVVNPTLAGNQLLGGSIIFNSVPEPSSFALVLVGGAGLIGFRRFRLRQAA